MLRFRFVATVCTSRKRAAELSYQRCSADTTIGTLNHSQLVNMVYHIIPQKEIQIGAVIFVQHIMRYPSAEM